MSRLITCPEVQQRIPYCRDHIRRLCKAGKFPKPVEVGPGRIACVEDEIEAYVAELVAKRDEQPVPSAMVPDANPDASNTTSGAPGKNATRPRAIDSRQVTAQPRQQYVSSTRKASSRHS
jgi:prophage regulatory protein